MNIRPLRRFCFFYSPGFHKARRRFGRDSVVCVWRFTLQTCVCVCVWSSAAHGVILVYGVSWQPPAAGGALASACGHPGRSSARTFPAPFFAPSLSLNRNSTQKPDPRIRGSSRFSQRRSGQVKATRCRSFQSSALAYCSRGATSSAELQPAPAQAGAWARVVKLGIHFSLASDGTLVISGMYVVTSAEPDIANHVNR